MPRKRKSFKGYHRSKLNKIVIHYLNHYCLDSKIDSQENTDIGELIKTRKTEIDELEKENSILRDENKILAEKAAKAEPLADMLAEILAE